MAVIAKSEGTKSESGLGTSISIHSEVAESLCCVKWNNIIVIIIIIIMDVYIEQAV